MYVYLFAYFVKRTLMYNSCFLTFQLFSNYFGIYYRSYLSIRDLGHIWSILLLLSILIMKVQSTYNFFIPPVPVRTKLRKNFFPLQQVKLLYLQQNFIQIEDPSTPMSSIPRCSRGNTVFSMIVGTLSCSI